MSEFTLLREAVDVLATRSASPDFGELKRRATRRGRRRMVVVVASGAVALIAMGGGLAAGTLRGGDQSSPVGELSTGSSESPTAPESAAPPSSLLAFGEAFDAIVEQVPGWRISRGPFPTDYDYAFTGACSKNWINSATGGVADGGAPSNRNAAGFGNAGFETAAQASNAAARLIESLTSCTTTVWQSKPIARTGGVLAFSTEAVAWIQRTGDTVIVLQVMTADGPPPVGVQVKVAEWMVAFHTWLE